MSLRIKDQLPDARPRERLANGEEVSAAELLAILLRTGMKGRNVVEVASELLRKFDNNLDRLSRAPLEELRVKGIGLDKAVTLKAAFRLANKITEQRLTEDPLLDTPERIANFMREQFRDATRENFFAIFLNKRRHLIRREHLTHGTAEVILVHPRDVFQRAIAANATGVVLVHNHPSGDPTPSEADISVTKDLIRAGYLLRIEIWDHIIIGRPTVERPKDFVSLRELGHFAGA